MIATGGDSIAARIGARKPDGAIERIGSVLAEFDHIRPLDDGQKFLSAFEFDARRTRKIGSQRQRALYGFDYRRERVSECDCAQTHAVFDELVAVHVPYMTAKSALDDAGHVVGKLVRALGIRVSAAWNQRLRTIVQLATFVESLATKVHGGAGLRSWFCWHRGPPNSRSA